MWHDKLLVVVVVVAAAAAARYALSSFGAENSGCLRHCEEKKEPISKTSEAKANNKKNKCIIINIRSKLNDTNIRFDRM